MQTSDVRGSLEATGEYRTDTARRRALLDRALGRLDLWFYLRVITVVWRGGLTARRGRYTNTVWERQSQALLSAMEACGGRVEVAGFEHLRAADGPVVYISNHMSMLETVLLPAMLLAHGPVAFVVKDALLRYPGLGSVLRATHAISVSRNNPREDLKTVLTEGTRVLQEGRSVVIFPQATRSTVFEPAAFNSLGVKLARRAGVPMAPLALKTDFLGIGKWLRDCGPLDRTQVARFRFGAPLACTGTARDLHAQVVRFVSTTLREWGVETRGPEQQSG